MIEMKNVSKKYPNGVQSLDDISVNIERGEFIYVVGPSGAGKTTFIKLVNGEEIASKGIVRVGDFNTRKVKRSKIYQLRREVGVVFQDFKLLPRLTAFENIAYAMEVLEKPKDEIYERVMTCLSLVSLTHKADMFPQELSGGEQQRIAIARALTSKPKIVIADEPTGNLDPDTSWEIMTILEHINKKGTTVIMATHNAEIVNTNKHRVIAFEDSHIVRDEEGGEYGYDEI